MKRSSKIKLKTYKDADEILYKNMPAGPESHDGKLLFPIPISCKICSSIVTTRWHHWHPIVESR
jgi:hypothetical protein